MATNFIFFFIAENYAIVDLVAKIVSAYKNIIIKKDKPI